MKKIPLYLQILAALILGMAAGCLWPGIAGYVDWIATLFMNALGLLIVPIIFFSISTSVARISGGGGETFRRIGGKTLGWYLLTMAIAVATGVGLVFLIRPGAGAVAGAALQEIPDPVTHTDVKDIVTGFIPSNFIAALGRNNTIPVIFLALVVGFFVTRISEESQASMLRFLQAGYELTMKVTGWILQFAPLGIFAVVAVQFAKIGDVWGMLKGMLLYVLTVAAGLAVQTFVSLPLLLRVVGRVRPWKHFLNMSVPMVTAFSTASSGATLPFTMEAVRKKDGVSEGITQFVVSLGATVNMNGAALLECVAVIFIAQVYGVQLTLLQTLLVSLVSILCAIGSAGIPMSAMVMMAIILSAVGLPVEGIGLVIGVDRILDMLRTAVNVFGDTCVAVLVAKSEGERLPIDR
ncbi:MAG: dicarboxylate/amino acid:cation symporter [Bacteroidales bacterium]|nr:dicarboxylate/amino acid:cation symporter [Bacteroidales bacterium]